MEKKKYCSWSLDIVNLKYSDIITQSGGGDSNVFGLDNAEGWIWSL